MSSFLYNCAVSAYNAAALYAGEYVTTEAIDVFQKKMIDANLSPFGKAGMLCGLGLVYLGSPIIGACVGLAGYALTRGRQATIQFFLDATDRGIDQIVRASKTSPSSRNMLVFRSTYDHNGYLASRKEVARYEHFSKRCQIDLVRSRTTTEYRQQVALLRDKYDIILYDCHSYPHACLLSEQVLFSSNSQKSIQWLKDKVKENGMIIFQGCNTGNGEACISKVVSQACPSVAVFGSGDNLYSRHIAYDDRCVPTFTTDSIQFAPDQNTRKIVPVFYKKNITKKFVCEPITELHLNNGSNCMEFGPPQSRALSREDAARDDQ